MVSLFLPIGFGRKRSSPSVMDHVSNAHVNIAVIFGPLPLHHTSDSTSSLVLRLTTAICAYPLRTVSNDQEGINHPCSTRHATPDLIR